MDLPSLRHFQNAGIYFISSDPVEVLHGEAWVSAIYTDKGWATADGSTLLTGIEEWRDDQEEGQGSQGDGRVQAGDAPKRQARPRQGSKSKKPQAGNSHCSI